MNREDQISEILEDFEDMKESPEDYEDADVYQVISNALSLLHEIFDDNDSEEYLNRIIDGSKKLLLRQEFLASWGSRLLTEKAEKYFAKYDISKVDLQYAYHAYVLSNALESSTESEDSLIVSDHEEEPGSDEESEADDSDTSSKASDSPPKRAHSV